MSSVQTRKPLPKTKIVCTLGPSTRSEETMRALIENGMSVARLNLSHGDLQTHTADIAQVRHLSDQLGVPVGIMVDVPGSKYRTGPLGSGVANLKAGETLTLTSDDLTGSEDVMSVSPPGIHRDATVGLHILLDDGLVELIVRAIDGHNVRCEVIAGGRITERRGVATPGKAPSLKLLGPEAENALRFAAKQQADFVAMSMVTKDSDVHSVRRMLDDYGVDALIISKIERAEALKNLDSILEASDGIMVARGDMGVEVPLARVPIIQKDLISRCNSAGKFVITATQMLESMVNSPIPTRAEVTDVANAIFDGTDAIMLSGETSVGQHPAQAVKVMSDVALEAEAALPYERIISEKVGQQQTDDAISYDACRTAFQLKASLIVAFTESGSTANRVSKYRPQPPILALTPHARVRRRMTLRWGVMPVIAQVVTSIEDFFLNGQEQAMEAGLVDEGDLVVLVAGLPIGLRGTTNLLRVMTISSSESDSQ